MLTKHELEIFEHQLEEMRRATETTLKHLDDDLDFGDDVDSFEEETDESEEAANRAGVRNALKEKLENIKTALEKLRRGVYGTCEKCGRAIELEVLHAAPESHLCRKCKRGQ